MRNMDYSRKRYFTLMLVFSLLIYCFFLPEAEMTGMDRNEGRKQYTVMFYICGSDLERDYGQMTGEMHKILDTHYNVKAVNAIGLLGGTLHWEGNAFDPGVLNVVEIAGDRPSEIDKLPLSAMSESATLSNFLSYCYTHFPAEHYILTICDHGGGPLYGCCVDYMFQKQTLSVNALKEALANSPFADCGLDIIAFNCCLMGSAEIANSLSSYAKYMVATEDSMFGIGYDWLKDIENDETVLETARRMAQSTYEHNKEIIAKQHASELNSVSVVDLHAIQDVVSAVDDYYASLPELNESSFTAVSNQRRNAVEFGVTESGGNSQYDLADLGSLVASMEDGSRNGAELQSALQAAVPIHFSDVDNCAGMTVYHPYLNKMAALQYMETYASLGFASSYTNYVIQYAAIMTGTPLADWRELMIDLPVQKDQRTLFSLQLSEEQSANLGCSRMIVLLKEGDGDYRFTYLTLDTSLSDGRMTGEYSGEALYVVDSEGNPMTKPLPYRISPRGVYLIPAELMKSDENGTVSRQTLIYCSLDPETRQLIPGGVTVWDETIQAWTGNILGSFSDYSEIAIRFQTKKESRNSEEILLPFSEWETASEEIWNAEIDESWSFRLLNDTMEPENLYAAFEVQDSQGNQYLSELHTVKTGVSTAEELRVLYDDANLVKIDSFTVSALNQLTLAAEIVNLTETETIISLKNLVINGSRTNISAEVYGKGPNWGLMQDEKQVLVLNVPPDALEGMNTIQNLDFDLVLSNASDSEELGTVPVKVTLLLELNPD